MLPRHERKGGWAIALLLLSLGLIGGTGWLAVQLVVNPQANQSVNRWFPGWLPRSGGLTPPRTLAEIDREIQQMGRMGGDRLFLGMATSLADGRSPVAEFLLPLWMRRPHCPQNCDQIVELQIYQAAPGVQDPGRFYRVSQMAIAGPEESFVIAPLVDAQSDTQGSARALPLTRLDRLTEKAPPGIWLSLSGEWIRGKTTVTYGRLVRYNPSRSYLAGMLDWSSPAGDFPRWQEITGGGTAELLINQTIGMDPQVRMYQVKAVNFLPNPLQLEAISLREPAVSDPTVGKALLLARHGLWSTAASLLAPIERRDRPRGKWSAAAQAQMDMVGWHARQTRIQAEQSWSSPAQQILAHLMDGRWQSALALFSDSADISRETALLLRADPGRVQKRVQAALQVDPTQFPVKAWGALLLAAQRDRATAIGWLQKQPQTAAADISRIALLLNRLQASFIDSAESSSRAPGQLIGSVQRLPRVTATEWYSPKPLPSEGANAWYGVQITAFHNGRRWQTSHQGLELPKRATIASVWKFLGLQVDQPLQLTFWATDGQPYTLTGRIQAIRLQGKQVQLLAIAEPLPTGISPNRRPRPLAITETGLEWLSPTERRLADQVQQHPAWAASAIPLLKRELQQAGELPAGSSSTWKDLASLGLGDWVVQTLPLSNHRIPDVLLTIAPQWLEQLPVSRSGDGSDRPRHPRTVIFSGGGKLLYSEFSHQKQNTFLAIANRGDTLPALLVDTPNHYTWLRWSANRQRFE